ncbi:MAG: hypothetical protein ACLQPD_04940 [Desulfomonilaceae bacterium]
MEKRLRVRLNGFCKLFFGIAVAGALLASAIQVCSLPHGQGCLDQSGLGESAVPGGALGHQTEHFGQSAGKPIELAQTEQLPPSGTSTPPAGVFPVRLSAVLKGISNYDAVGPGKIIAPDNKPNGLFVLSVQGQNKEVTAIEIGTTDAVSFVWDTVPGSSHWAVAVASVEDPIRLLNKRDGSVSIKVKDRADLNLYVADNGSIAAGKTNYRIEVAFSDGSVAWTPVQKVTQPAQERSTDQAALSNKVNFLGTFLGFSSTNAVGPYPGLKPGGKPDAVFGLDIEITPKNFITGIDISPIDGTGRRWSTTGAPDTWGLAVAYQSAATAILNRPDGSIRIPIDGRAQFYLYVADPGDIATTYHQMRILVYLADGSAYQQIVRRPGATTTTVVPVQEGPTKAKGLITCEFRGFVADLVNFSNRPGKSGYLNGTLVLKLEVDNKKLAKVEMSGSDGVVQWSSDGKPGTMFLGVTQYPQIYKLINEKGSMMQQPFSSRRTFYLYAADNGMLTNPASRLTVTVTFTDKSSLATEVIK